MCQTLLSWSNLTCNVKHYPDPLHMSCIKSWSYMWAPKLQLPKILTLPIANRHISTSTQRFRVHYQLLEDWNEPWRCQATPSTTCSYSLLRPSKNGKAVRYVKCQWMRKCMIKYHIAPRAKNFGKAAQLKLQKHNAQQYPYVHYISTVLS